MDTALIERLLSPIPDTFKRDFEQARLKNPNMNFCDTFQVFLDLYGSSSETERQVNKDSLR